MLNKPFHVLIPARMQSSRLPQKMILDIGGFPLIVKTALQAQKSQAKQVIIATDHEAIFEICEKYQIKVCMTSANHQSGTDRLAEVVNQFNLNNDEIIINVQGDEPLIDPNLINQLAEFINHKNTDVATIAHPIHKAEEIFNPNVVKVILDNWQNALYFSRATIPFYRDGFTNTEKFVLPSTLNLLRHIGIYAYSVKFLKQYHGMPSCPLEQVECLEQLRTLYNGHKIAVLISQLIPEAGVDTIEDLQRVRKAMEHQEEPGNVYA